MSSQTPFSTEGRLAAVPGPKGSLVFICVSILGLALYLWGALAAPVVLWSDSTIDMAWARAGIGIVKPVPAPPPGEPLVHPPKVGYLIFLAGAMRVAPALGPARSIVLTQSLLVWLSIVGTSWLVARRAGMSAGLVTLGLLLAILRIRDASSAVMSEAISAAIFLPLAASVLFKPERLRGSVLMGVAAALLFAVRPDVGAILVLVTAAVLLGHRSGTSFFAYTGSFLLLTIGVWAATRTVSGPDPLRGVGHPILQASAAYYWRPALGNWPSPRTQKEMGREELARAAQNWRRFLAHFGPDTRRELVWRSFHGLLGTEYYVPSWSGLYGRLDQASRVLTPFCILAAMAALILPSRPPESGSRIAGAVLLILIVGHNLVFGSNPRYLIPMLPFLLLLLALRLPRADFSMHRLAVAAAVFALLVWAASRQREVLDWQWGIIESAGVTIRQPIPRGSFPEHAPATLHVRIAAPLIPTNTQIAVSADGQRIGSSEGNVDRTRPDITVALPAWVLERNTRQRVELELTSFGDFGPYSYLMFPVVPPPWGVAAMRSGRVLSPSTGVVSGGLDWWAHPGND